MTQPDLARLEGRYLDPTLGYGRGFQDGRDDKPFCGSSPEYEDGHTAGQLARAALTLNRSETDAGGFANTVAIAEEAFEMGVKSAAPPAVEREGEQEDGDGKEYCYRIADAVLAVPPFRSFVEGIEEAAKLVEAQAGPGALVGDDLTRFMLGLAAAIRKLP